MDTGEGKFVDVDIDAKPELNEMLYSKLENLEEVKHLRGKYPKSKGIFSVGEILEIKGSRFEVRRINVYGILLKLLPAKEQVPPRPNSGAGKEAESRSQLAQVSPGHASAHPAAVKSRPRV